MLSCSAIIHAPAAGQVVQVELQLGVAGGGIDGAGVARIARVHAVGGLPSIRHAIVIRTLRRDGGAVGGPAAHFLSRVDKFAEVTKATVIQRLSRGLLNAAAQPAAAVRRCCLTLFREPFSGMMEPCRRPLPTDSHWPLSTTAKLTVAGWLTFRRSRV